MEQVRFVGQSGTALHEQPTNVQDVVLKTQMTASRDVPQGVDGNDVPATPDPTVTMNISDKTINSEESSTAAPATLQSADVHVDLKAGNVTPQPAISAAANTAPENADATMTDAALAYSTRTRNRHGASRPNYAEDQDNMDFEYTAPPKANTKQAATSNEQKRASDANSNKFVPINGLTTDDKTTPRESTPATLSSSTATSKKRKAASAAATNAQSAIPAASTTNSSTTRRTGSLTTSLHRPETNMMTFEKSKSKLKDGKLTADDGTVLNING